MTARNKGYGAVTWSTAPERVWIYAIGCEGFVKIGIAADVTERAANMQVGCPFDMVVLYRRGVHRLGAAIAESHAHAMLQAYHHRGEWFRCSVEAARRAIDIATKRGGRVADRRQRAAQAEERRHVAAAEQASYLSVLETTVPSNVPPFSEDPTTA